MRLELVCGSVSYYLVLNSCMSAESFIMTSSIKSHLHFYSKKCQLTLHRPANILLNEKSVPVLVDFGFAEKNDLKSSTAFHSNLSYGTPEVGLLFFCD